MKLGPGTHFGSYDILDLLGAGGMGEVYRARDTKLHREVAIKILPATLANQPDRILRFEREAHLLAALNHPHIAQIYGMEEAHGIRALVMELVPGVTLAERIRARTIQAGEALAIATQITGALEAAHEKGIIHRDLKPGNVMITPDGEVKLLDFGLGKSLEPEASGDMANSPTMTSGGTEAGMLLGTAAYMAPEQAKGRAADRRSDVWAFGCVLFEMLSGRRAFEGEDVSDTLAAILRGEPDWRALPPDTPPHIRSLLHRCLEKNRKLRIRDIGDVEFELSHASPDRAMTPPAPPAPQASRTRERLLWAAALVLVGAAAAAAAWWQRTPEPAFETRLEITTPPTSDNVFDLSPNGRQIVFAALVDNTSVLWLRSLDSTVARPLGGTEGGTNPFWSPDSRSIGFFQGNTLKRLDLASGVVQTIAADAATGSAASWGATGILFRQSGRPSGLLHLPASGGQPVEVTKLANGATGHRWPMFLPDGRTFVFNCAGPENVRGVYLGSLDSSEITRLTDTPGWPLYFPTGWLLFDRLGSFVARRLDLGARSLVGDEVIVAEQVDWTSVSASGLLAYRQGAAPKRQLTWLDRTGKVLGTLGAADTLMSSPELSPDGQRAAVYRFGQGSSDVWIISSLNATRFTFGPAPSSFPLWSPDGSRIAYLSGPPGKREERIKAADGSGTDELLAVGVPPTVFIGMTDWSRDGKHILVDKSPVDIWAIPTSTGEKPFPIIDGTPHSERLARFSPDGRWIAYQSNEAKRTEIYVRPFGRSGGQRLVSTAGGTQPRWRHDGTELYWIAPDSTLMAAAITLTPNAIDSGAPKALFKTRIFLGGYEQPDRGQYTVSADGRFLINAIVDEGATPSITIVQNWQPVR